MPLSEHVISESIKDLTGLTAVSNFSTNRIRSIWRFVEFPRPIGFSIDFSFELGVARATLSLDSLASPLVKELNEFTARNWSMIQALLEALDRNSMSIQVMNRGSLVDAANNVFDGTFNISGKAISHIANDAASGLMSAMISLFGFMAGEESSFDVDDFKPEGASHQALTRRYERSRFNRNIAIQIHGLTCKACGFNFRNFYGELGAGVIEVHHLMPVHLMSEVRVVDPRTELVPLCSNCHTMAHRIDPPITLAELRNMVAEA